MKIYDIIEKTVKGIILDANEILETKEILELVQVSLSDTTRTKLFSRLNNLRGDGVIKGKCVGSGKGVWIWWSPDLFIENHNSHEENSLDNQLVNETGGVKYGGE